MAVTCILGELGSGKSTVMAAWAHWYIYRAGRVLVTDMSLKGLPHERIPDILTDEYVRSWFRGSKADIKARWWNRAFLLDEAWSKVDAMDYKRPEVKLMGYFILMSRKLGVDITYAAQEYRLVYNRWRMNTNFYWQCEDAGNDVTMCYQVRPISDYDVAPTGKSFPVPRRWFYQFFDTYDLVLPRELLEEVEA